MTKNREGEIAGPTYGFQWPHFGASTKGAMPDKGSGGRSANNVVSKLIRTQPKKHCGPVAFVERMESRAMHEMDLQPCHVL